mgnify:CR=1
MLLLALALALPVTTTKVPDKDQKVKSVVPMVTDVWFGVERKSGEVDSFTANKDKDSPEPGTYSSIVVNKQGDQYMTTTVVTKVDSHSLAVKLQYSTLVPFVENGFYRLIYIYSPNKSFHWPDSGTGFFVQNDADSEKASK